MHWSGSRLSSTACVLVAACCCGLLNLAGCNKGQSLGNIVPVQGKVTLDGKPLTGGGVIFHAVVEKDTNAPISVPLGAPLQDDGAYKLRVPAGKYRVQLDRGAKGDKKVWSQIGQKYTSAKSPLVIDVEEDKPEGGYDVRLLSTGQQRR